jgi:hypothetical protein
MGKWDQGTYNGQEGIRGKIYENAAIKSSYFDKYVVKNA